MGSTQDGRGRVAPAPRAEALRTARLRLKESGQPPESAPTRNALGWLLDWAEEAEKIHDYLAAQQAADFAALLKRIESVERKGE